MKIHWQHAARELGLMLAFTVLWGFLQPTVERLLDYCGDWTRTKELGFLALPLLLASRMLHNYAHAGTHKLLHRAQHAVIARFACLPHGGPKIRRGGPPTNLA